MTPTLDQIEQQLARNVNNIDGVPEGAYNFRLDGKSIGRASSEHINIIPREDKHGINVYVDPGTQGETVHILVMLKAAGLVDLVKSDFYIGAGADVTIIAGCGIYNCGAQDSRHDGLHNFHLAKGAKVHYIEKLYGFGPGASKILNPTSAFFLAEEASVFAEIEQLRGIDSSTRSTRAELAKNAKLNIEERTLTQGRQTVESAFDIQLNGADSSVRLVSRTVAEDESTQIYRSRLTANAPARGHSECDTILRDSAHARAIPELAVNDKRAELIHEAAIGRLNREQILKLMTLGFSEKEAEAKIINGFLA